jgi:hypothetical protein
VSQSVCQASVDYLGWTVRKNKIKNTLPIKSIFCRLQVVCYVLGVWKERILVRLGLVA